MWIVCCERDVSQNYLSAQAYVWFDMHTFRDESTCIIYVLYDWSVCFIHINVYKACREQIDTVVHGIWDIRIR